MRTSFLSPPKLLAATFVVVAALCAHAAFAQTNPFSWATAFAVRTVFPKAAQVLARIDAGVQANSAFIVGVGSAYVITSSLSSPLGLDDNIGLAPASYSTPGAPNFGTLVVAENSSTRERTAVVINSRSREEVMNPDLGDSKAAVASTGPWVLAESPGIYVAKDLLSTGSSGYISPPEPFLSQLTIYLNATVGKSGWLKSASTYYPGTIRLGSSCKEVITSLQSTATSWYNSNRHLCVMVSGSSGSTGWTYTSLTSSVAAKTCDEGYTYDPATNQCVFKPAGLDDGYCLVSPSSATLKYEYNAADPDCLKAVAAGMSMSPGSPGGGSTPPVAPSVTLVNASSGSVLIQEAPSLVDPTAPLSKVTSRVPDPANNITRETVINSAPGSATSSNPSAAPVPSTTQSNIYPGTSPGATTASPMQQVAVSNWPSTLNVTGTVACSNCTPAAQQPVEVNVPDRMKIDGEVPVGQEALPTAPADLESSTFFDPLKNKLAGLMNFQLPAHSSSCPSINISWHVWRVDFDVSSDYMCQTLEQHRGLIQGLMHFFYLAGSVIILLGA